MFFIPVLVFRPVVARRAGFVCSLLLPPHIFEGAKDPIYANALPLVCVLLTRRRNWPAGGYFYAGAVPERLLIQYSFTLLVCTHSWPRLCLYLTEPRGRRDTPQVTAFG